LDDRPDREEEYMVKAEVYAQIDAPIELHVASRSEFEKWYKKFIGEDLVRI
jgi:predicted nucleotidyltransferase